MHYSIFLARWLGLILTIIGLGLLFNRKHFLSIATSVEHTAAAQFVATLLPLTLGSLLIISHNVWTGWPIIITILGWIFFISGIFRAWMPTVWLNAIHKNKETALPMVVFFIVFIIGLVLLYFGFF